MSTVLPRGGVGHNLPQEAPQSFVNVLVSRSMSDHFRGISEFELGDAEPPLPVLLKYARIAGVNMEDLVDDELDLPAKLPGNLNYQGLKRQAKSRRNR